VISGGYFRKYLRISTGPFQNGTQQFDFRAIFSFAAEKSPARKIAASRAEMVVSRRKRLL